MVNKLLSLSCRTFTSAGVTVEVEPGTTVQSTDATSPRRRRRRSRRRRRRRSSLTVQPGTVDRHVALSTPIPILPFLSPLSFTLLQLVPAHEATRSVDASLAVSARRRPDHALVDI